MTVTLFKVIQSELIKAGHSEFEEEEPATDIFPFGKFAYYNKEYQFTEKIMEYDKDIEDIISYLFHGLGLEDKEHDTHFKKMFMYRFVNRYINRQTIEAFKMELMGTFLTNKHYITNVYSDIENYMTQTQTTDNTNSQTNKQKNDSTNTSNNRTAFADLPQNNVNLNVDNDEMQYATDNTITKNKQNNKQETEGETTGINMGVTKSYQFDELIKSSSLMENVLNKFDMKCFMQVW